MGQRADSGSELDQVDGSVSTASCDLYWLRPVVRRVAAVVHAAPEGCSFIASASSRILCDGPQYGRGTRCGSFGSRNNGRGVRVVRKNVERHPIGDLLGP